MRGIVAICISLMALAAAAHAADRPVPPPVPPLDTMNAKPVKATFARSFTLGGKPFDYEGARISNLPRTLGAGAVNQMTDLAWVCFDLPGGQRVWFSGEGSADLNTVTLARQGAASSQCPAMPAKFTPVVIDQDLHIGVTRAEVLKRLGQPSRQVDTWMVYSSEYDHGRTGLAIQFADDKAVFISASNRDGRH
jgi:hypothetical protein